MLMRRVSVFLLLLCLGCTAQSIAPETKQRIEQQVRAVFNLPPDVTVDISPTRASDFPNYDALTVTLSREGKNQKVEFLLSKDNKTLLRMTKIDLTKDLYAEAMSKIDTQGRPVRGNPNAKVTLVNYDDFQCPFCSRMHATLMTEILPQYGDKIKIIYKDYPLPMHPWAPHAANDANCLAKASPQGYWDLADYLHANQRAISSGGSEQKSAAELDRLTLEYGKKYGADSKQLQACVKAQSDAIVKTSVAEGDSVGVSATPTLFVNGVRLEGAVDAAEVRAVLDERLRAVGVQPPPPPPATPQATPTSK